MSIYICRFTYPSVGYAATLEKPNDREAAAQVGFGAVGAKVRDVYYSAATGELVCIAEGDAAQMSAARMMTMAAGAPNVSVEDLITPSEMAAAMKLAGKAASKYKPNQLARGKHESST